MALVLAALMMMAMSAVAFAAETKTTYTIKMTTTTGHTYTAYQVFAGDLDENTTTDEEGASSTTKTLSNIVWGNGVDGEALLVALKADETYGKDFVDCTSAADVADVLATYSDDSAAIKAIAKIISANKQGDGTSSTASDDVITISGLEAGYYLVIDSTAEDKMPDYDTYSDLILQVVSDVEVKAKDGTVEFDKDIVEDEVQIEASDYNIGDTVTYQLTGKLPNNFKRYEKYEFIFHDTMSDGLDFNDTSVVVKIGNTTLTAGTDYELVTSPKDGCTFEVVFKDMTKVDAADDSATVTVDFTATLNSNAVIGGDGNPNEAKLEFSNNPSDNSKGTTPVDTVIVWTYEVDVTKVDGEDENKKLKDAEFVLYKTVDDTNSYVQVDSNNKVTGWTTSKDEASTLKSGEDGLFNVIGLDSGTYYLEETKAPAGYNLLADPVEYNGPQK